MSKSQIPDEVTGAELASIIGVTDRTIRNLASSGVITRGASGKYVLATSIRSIIAEAKKSKQANALSRENEAIASGKRRLLELRLAQEEAKVIALDEAVNVVSEVVGTFRAGLDALPARISRDPAQRRQIKQECDVMLLRVSKKFESLKKGMTFDEDERSDDDE